MDLETVDAADFGRSLSGLGVNLLCRDVRAMATGSKFAASRHGSTSVVASFHSFRITPIVGGMP